MTRTTGIQKIHSLQTRQFPKRSMGILPMFFPSTPVCRATRSALALPSPLSEQGRPGSAGEWGQKNNPKNRDSKNPFSCPHSSVALPHASPRQPAAAHFSGQGRPGSTGECGQKNDMNSRDEKNLFSCPHSSVETPHASPRQPAAAHFSGQGRPGSTGEWGQKNELNSRDDKNPFSCPHSSVAPPCQPAPARRRSL
jgi:hypothetical protein